MFSGIVEEPGVVTKIVHKKNLNIISVKVKAVHRGTKIGDSISVDGVCLTVTHKANAVLTFDIMLETIRKTTLRYAQPGTRVNLERALKVSDRISGHFVSGHVDGVGVITDRITKENYEEFWVAVPKQLARYVVPKGCACIDGISLTVGEVGAARFSVYIIPHTLKVTTLGLKNEGDKVNIETDLLAKYVLSQAFLKRR